MGKILDGKWDLNPLSGPSMFQEGENEAREISFSFHDIFTLI